jgi:hypothetical protein
VVPALLTDFLKLCIKGVKGVLLDNRRSKTYPDQLILPRRLVIYDLLEMVVVEGV